MIRPLEGSLGGLGMILGGLGWVKEPRTARYNNLRNTNKNLDKTSKNHGKTYRKSLQSRSDSSNEDWSWKSGSKNEEDIVETFDKKA